MEGKTFNLFNASILILILCISFAFATVTITTPTSPSTLTKSSNSTIFTVNSSISSNFSYPSTATITDGDGNTITLSLSNTTSITSTKTATFEVNTTAISSGFNLEKNTKAVTITVANASNSTDTNTTNITLTFDNQNYCSLGNQGGNLTFGKVKLDNTEGFGDSDDEWYPLDKIEVDIRVDNDGNDDIDDIIVEWGVYSTKKDKWVIDNEENNFNLNDGKKETITVDFQVDPDDLNTDMGDDYVLYVKAYSDDIGENVECISNSDDITITLENDFVILDDISISDVALCGSEMQITADVWNIGEDDQEDVYVTIYNKELGIDQDVTLGDIDSLENERLSTSVEIPTDAQEKFHTIKFWVYDEDNEVYENNNNDDSEFNVPFKVEGGCASDSESGTPSALVTASLESGGNAGELLVIKATITNSGTDLATYIINPTDYDLWASSATIDETAFSLGSGQSKQVTVTLDVNDDASGENSFNIEVLSGTELIKTQPVAVTLEGKSGFSTITGRITSKSPLVWGTGLINVILIIIIIVVAIKVAKK
ncbi:hypothetical protein CMI44_02360 [Candidatus Pacearchaeota archaeon]|nr:hypothetical protein [Candidatus Pacearchaeota archaeon]